MRRFIYVAVLMNRLIHLGLWGCAVAQAVSRRPLTAESRLSQAVHVGSVVDKVTLRSALLWDITQRRLVIL